MTQSNLAALDELNQERLSWSTNRLLAELNGLQRELSQFEAESPDATPATVNRRFDILWSRLAQMEQGSVGARLHAYDVPERTLPMLFKVLRDSETAVVGLQPGQISVAREFNEALEPFELALTQFARKVFIGEEARTAVVRQSIDRSALLTALATIAAFLTTGLALFLVNRESHRNRRIADENLALAEAADQASSAKSQFLTMMSHELRTPMNGVLGMLALAKQSGMPKAQLRLVEQAETSGQQMIAMLADILDYSALQDHRMELEKKPFEPDQLADAIRDLFGAVARREGISLHVGCDPSCPERIEGDFRRLRQIVAHFASFIVETAGTENVDISLRHEDGNLCIAISFDYGQILDGEDAWRPEILLGTRPDGAEQFATDALGPSVARGILAQMGGSVRLDNPSNERISIELVAPAAEIEIDELHVLIDAKSEAVRTICKVGLSGEKVVFVDRDTRSRVHVALIEAGGHDEMTRLTDLADRFPNALLVAIGTPINPGDFDSHVSIPLDISELRQSVLQ